VNSFPFQNSVDQRKKNQGKKKLKHIVKEGKQKHEDMMKEVRKMPIGIDLDTLLWNAANFLFIVMELEEEIQK